MKIFGNFFFKCQVFGHFDIQMAIYRRVRLTLAKALIVIIEVNEMWFQSLEKITWKQKIKKQGDLDDAREITAV